MILPPQDTLPGAALREGYHTSPAGVMQGKAVEQPSGVLSVDYETGTITGPGVNTDSFATAYNLRVLLGALRADQWYPGDEVPDSRDISEYPVSLERIRHFFGGNMPPDHFEHMRGIAVKDVLRAWREHGTYLAESDETQLLQSMYPDASYVTPWGHPVACTIFAWYDLMRATGHATLTLEHHMQVLRACNRPESGVLRGLVSRRDYALNMQALSCITC